MPEDSSKGPDPYTAKNLEDPPLKEKVEDLKNFCEKTKFCMMTTHIDGSKKMASRCMALAATEGNGVDFVFHANNESGKTDDLEANSDVNLGFLNGSGEWASISGTASVDTDRATVHKYYSPALKAWVGELDETRDGGPDDPRICVIRVKANTAQYAVGKRTAIGAFIEFAKGVVSGETPDINKLMHLDESEIQQWRSTGA